MSHIDEEKQKPEGTLETDDNPSSRGSSYRSKLQHDEDDSSKQNSLTRYQAEKSSNKQLSVS